MIERLGVAFVVGLLGFLVGLFAWWTLSTVPFLAFGWRFYLVLSGGLGIVSFLLGLWRSHETMDFLGAAGRTIYSVGTEVLRWIKVLR